VRVHVGPQERRGRRARPGAGPDGEVVREWDDTPSDFGRIAASTAKQVIVQRLRDAEHEQTFGEYAGKEGDIVSGIVQADARRNASGTVLGRHRQGRGGAPAAEQVPGESYPHGSRLQRLRRLGARTFRGPQVTCPGPTPNLVRKLFALEVPEIADGTSRSPRSPARPGTARRSPSARRSPGSTPRARASARWGQRVRNVMSELHGEKIDIVDWSDDPATFVATRCRRPG
jgi:N utilization substance protein A